MNRILWLTVFVTVVCMTLSWLDENQFDARSWSAKIADPVWWRWFMAAFRTHVSTSVIGRGPANWDIRV